MITAFFAIALGIWAIIASAAAIESQQRCDRALAEADRLRREMYGAAQ